MVVGDLVLALPELILALAGMCLLLLGAFRPKAALTTVLALAVGTLILVLGAIVLTGREPATAFEGLFVVDAYGDFMKLLVVIGALITLIMSQRYIQREDMAHFEVPVLMLFATLGMLMMVSANDLISLYIGLELQSLSLYVIAAIRRLNLRSSEAGLKYFVLGALSSGLLLYGASLVYGFTGTTSFAGLAAAFAEGGHAAAHAGGHPELGLVIGLVLLLAGLAFKVSAVPFHMWTPDVYEGAPTAVTAFFATAPKMAAMALLVRVLIGPFGDLVGEWQQIIILISIGSMVLGAFAAINQTNIKRLMAYSSIGHIGYALVGLAAGTEAGVRGLIVYMAIYLVMNLGTFACILAMRRREVMVEDIEDLKGLSRSHPLMALALAIFMFSMAGIPPLAGFFGKLYVFLAAIEAELYALAVIGVLASVVGAFYYVRIVKFMYFDEATDAIDRPIGDELAWVMGGTAVVIFGFFLLPGPVINQATAAAATLFGG